MQERLRGSLKLSVVNEAVVCLLYCMPMVWIKYLIFLLFGLLEVSDY